MSKKQKSNQDAKAAPAKKEAAPNATTASAADQKETLTKEQAVALAKHEVVIEEHLADFRKMGLALKAILDGRLYREAYTDFDPYCEERWDFSGSHARRLIVAAECMGVLEKEITPIGEKVVLPRNEAQVRALTDAQDSPKKWTKAWLKVLKSTEGVSITAEKIKEVLTKAGGVTAGQTKSTKAAVKPIADVATEKLTKIEQVVDDVLEKKEPTVAGLKKALTQIREVLKAKQA